MIFKHSFDNLTDDEIKLLDSYFDSMDYESSSHTFLANYIWRNTHKISWDIFEGYLVLSALDDEEPGDGNYFMSMPLTNTGSYDTEKLARAIREAESVFKAKGKSVTMTLVPEKVLGDVMKAMGDNAAIEHTPSEDDYIYLRSDLEDLKGRKYHQKKNHLNYFLANYDFEYQELTDDIISEVLDFVKSKNEYIMEDTPEDFKEILEMEEAATRELLKFIGGRAFGGVIRIDGEIKAVTIAEFSRTNSKETVIVHIEKADDRYRGLYQAINNEFVKRLPEETVFVNREEDMGLSYLRQAKEGYRPVKMGKKYTIKLLK